MSTQSKLLPLWVRFGSGRKLAGLNALSPLYLRSKESDYGGGDFGSLYALVDLAKSFGFSIIQHLPLFDTVDNPSPYQPISFFALNPVYLWVNDPFFEGIGIEIREMEMRKAKLKNPTQVKYGNLRKFKIEFLKQAYKEFKEDADFKEYKKSVLPQTLKYAQFCTLQEKYITDWQKWKTEVTDKEADFYLFVQWILEKQLMAVRIYAEQRDIYLCLDRPLYPAVQSSDVWANQDIFYLKSDGYPQYISGCNNPQDPFGKQIWGHAVYRFADKENSVKNFFIDSINYLSRFCHSIRLDHVSALIWKYYLIDPNTREGEHLPVNGLFILQEMTQRFADIYFIAEDTGFISDTEIDHPLFELGLPGVHCPQWQDEKNKDPKIYAYNSVNYSSTHDTLSLTGWSLTNGSKCNETFEEKYTKHIYQNFHNPSQLTFISIMDLLFDSRRFNSPGTPDQDNWQLRMLRKLEDVDLLVFKNTIINSDRNFDRDLNFQVIAKPNYPQKLKLKIDSSLKISIAAKFKINKLNIDHNFYGNNWQSLIINPDAYVQKQIGNIFILNYFMQIPQTMQKSIELAIAVCDENGEQFWLNQIGKNFKIDILQAA